MAESGVSFASKYSRHDSAIHGLGNEQPSHKQLLRLSAAVLSIAAHEHPLDVPSTRHWPIELGTVKARHSHGSLMTPAGVSVFNICASEVAHTLQALCSGQSHGMSKNLII